jgi:small subunit ribosomal protein S13
VGGITVAKDEDKPEKSEPKEKGKDKEKGKGKEKGKDKEEKKEKKKVEEENPDFKFLVRIVNTDIDGHRPLFLALTNVTGVGRRIALRIVQDLRLDGIARIGDMSDDDIDRISKRLENIHEVIPAWMMNRQKDYDTGDDLHLISTEVGITKRDDINRFKKIRSWKGVRHEKGYKVRGQRSKSNGRTGLQLGVIRSKAVAAAKAAAAAGETKKE